MAFDFKKEYKEFYMAKNKPEIITVPTMHYLAVRGQGNPNEVDGAYKQAVSVLYALAYTLKMSYKGDYKIKGFFEYVVPPLEGFWSQESICGVNNSDKAAFHWISVLRVPDFITQADLTWAATEVTRKKGLDCGKAELLSLTEGLCVQILHVRPFDDEPATVAIMNVYLAQNGYCTDITDTRLHHEIYLSDARRVAASKWRTVIRHPIKKQ